MGQFAAEYVEGKGTTTHCLVPINWLLLLTPLLEFTEGSVNDKPDPGANSDSSTEDFLGLGKPVAPKLM